MSRTEHPQHLPTFPLCRYYLADAPLDDGETEAWVDATNPAEATHMAALLYGSHWPGNFTHHAFIDASTGEECSRAVSEVGMVNQARAIIRKHLLRDTAE
jgi:hypothetical protein